MDEKRIDRSITSKKNHIPYYKSLTSIAANMQKELETESDDIIINHLKNRIDAINKDKKRIEEMFPDINWNEI